VEWRYVLVHGPNLQGIYLAELMPRMRIAQVAPLYESVPPKLYGGTERVVSWLTDELVRRGHDVTLFAAGDSETDARLVAGRPRALRLEAAGIDATWAHSLQLGEVFSRARDFDVIHCHVDFLGFPFGRRVATPTVHTLHGRLDVRHLRFLLEEFTDVPLVSISDAQRRPVADLPLAWQATVPHGLPHEGIPFRADTGDYIVFLGRISPEKRPDLAIAVARRLGIPIRLAAKIDTEDRPYFEREIRPLLDDPLVEFLGEVSGAAKYDLLGGARCLLFPIDWPEPFGLAMIEALACGTPVVARPCGSVPEIVEDGVTGWLGDTVDDLARAVKRVDVIDRARCRAAVERRFSVTAMAERYEAVYEGLVDGKRAERAA
jgi:glycosyltransferase involved in cell wall biosynthesis